ncbi:MAG: hypothetical protein JXQ69_03740 [Paludibacteraceae bacterium]|nr:hypothetical protein [Paludibacteraceae bacterium]
MADFDIDISIINQIAFTVNVLMPSEPAFTVTIQFGTESGGASDNVTITGTGTSTDPFKISEEYQRRINAGI